MQKLQPDLESFYHNRKVILALLYLAGGTIKRFSRLQLALYALKGKTLGLHTYKFEERCSWGPADSQFRSDLHLLCGDIIFGLYRDANGKIPHGEYKLHPTSVPEAKKLTDEIQLKNPQAYEKIREVAKLVGQSPEQIQPMILFNKYVNEKLHEKEE